MLIGARVREIAESEYDAQHVVEVVGNASGQASYSFHFLRLPKLLFQTFGFGYIGRDGKDARLST
jgi:hypothetical protein